jgi:hypothetical protein
MNIRKLFLGAVAVIAGSVALSATSAAADRPWTEGTVSNVSSIRTAPGRFDDYMAFLAKTYKPLMEAQKAAGNIVDYHIYTAMPRSPDDPDVFLVVTYKNMAALDGLRDRMEPIQEKLQGDAATRQAAMIARGSMRTQLGSEMVRQLVLK